MSENNKASGGFSVPATHSDNLYPHERLAHQWCHKCAVYMAEQDARNGDSAAIEWLYGLEESAR
jgi:hypothetical protein